MPHFASDETHYQVLRLLDRRPELTQRELADELGVSVGKANYVLNALIEKGLVKARNFKNSRNKAAYAYFLTPAGIEEKGRVAVRFLRRKMEEYEQIKREIEELKKELDERGSSL
ncbi:MarR family EPS-associated transcriptional regulator [Leptonema illini]|uniref:Regulatory protein MarR n=1 Tax=Leptonema illini DSM 21528 TaxID=929563 RepID=H2CD70_9LEPT|nr:MarR family EPS-associated transcriptional regulator [Leptonema illini]EHQ07546.1 regulatory protein MarR [Leptonema illini DSM 21528]